MLSSYYCEAKSNLLMPFLEWMLPKVNNHGIYVFAYLLNYGQSKDTACGIAISKQA